MGVRRHPVVLAAILSDFVVRAIEIAAAINRGRRGNLDRAFIRTLARDLGRDLGRAREYAQVRHLKLDVTVTRNSALALTLDQTRERYLAAPSFATWTPLSVSPVSSATPSTAPLPAIWIYASTCPVTTTLSRPASSPLALTPTSTAPSN